VYDSRSWFQIWSWHRSREMFPTQSQLRLWKGALLSLISAIWYRARFVLTSVLLLGFFNIPSRTPLEAEGTFASARARWIKGTAIVH